MQKHFDIEHTLSGLAGTFGLYIEDISTNKVLVDINSSKQFPSASVAKVFIAGYIQDLLDSSDLDLNDKVFHKAEHTLQGSGFLKYIEPGREFSILELLKLMLIESDNTASKMLINKVGVTGINSYLKSFDFMTVSGLKVENDKFVGWGVTTPFEVAKFLQLLLEKDCVTKDIMKDVDASDNIGYHLQKPYEESSVVIYSKGGTLHPRVKNVVALLENTEINKKIIVSYFSKDLSGVKDSVVIIRSISKEINNYISH